MAWGHIDRVAVTRPIPAIHAAPSAARKLPLTAGQSDGLGEWERAGGSNSEMRSTGHPYADYSQKRGTGTSMAQL